MFTGGAEGEALGDYNFHSISAPNGVSPMQLQLIDSYIEDIKLFNVQQIKSLAPTILDSILHYPKNLFVKNARVLTLFFSPQLVCSRKGGYISFRNLAMLEQG